MNDRMDEKNNNNINDNNVKDNEDEDIEGEEESDEESDDETISDEEEDNEDFDEETDENSITDDEIDNQLNGLESIDVFSPDSEPTCYICLNLFSGQEVGNPDSCDLLHYFCLDCIEEWSKQINTCPVDRKRFNYIIVRREIGSNVIMKLPIVQNIVPEVESVPEDVTFCEICGRCDREDRLLLCDGCDFGYHCECLSPPIETIPIEEWFCPDCYERLFGTENRNGLAVNPHQRRAIARTGASEAVRQRILARRTQRQKRTTRKRKRKRTSRKTKTRRKTTTKSKTGKKRKTRRRKKRKTKKSVFASSRLPAADARKRIASKLGLGSAPKSPFGLPSMKNLAYESIRRISDLRAAAGISNLSMFGSELDIYDPRIITEDEVIDVGSDGLLARSRVGRLIHSPLKKTLSLPENQMNSSANTSSIDILAEIMSSQAILHSSSRDVTIGRDGSLHLNRNSVLPVRNCPNSGPSSPQRTPPSASNSPQRTDSNSNSSNAFNYSFGGQTSAMNSNSSYCHEDIASIKPSVSQITTDVDDSKLELYSDIESIGDNNNNKDDSDDEEDDQKLIIDDNGNLKSDHNINANSAQISQSSGKSDQTNDNNERTNSTSDIRSIDISKSVNTSSDISKGQQKKIKTNLKSSDAKRRLSIKDLFGDSDDEEEDDSDIRQLLAEKGSINVHYPIKMSIVLKNSMNKRDANLENVDKELINSEKQLSNIDNNKESVVKSDNKLVSDENKEVLSVSPSKWKSIESNSEELVSTQSDPNKWKPIEVTEDKEFISQEVDNIEERIKNLETDDSIDVNKSGSDVLMTQNEDKDDDEDMGIEEEEGEIRDDVSKVRRCRHGRIRREKNRDNKEAINKEAIGPKSRHRSRSNESKGKKRESGNNNDSNSNDCVEVEANVETKDQKSESKELELTDNENNEKIGWKKLSNTSKLRSYRDGKPKDEELLFREREVPKKLIKKSTNIKTKSKDIKDTNKGSKDSDRYRDHERVKERRHEDNHNNSDAKHSRKHRSEERIIDERVRHKRKSDDILSSSAVKTKKLKKYEEKSLKTDSRRHSRTRSTDDSYGREKERRRHHHKKHKQSSSAHKKEDSITDERGLRHHRKHSHHSKKSSNDDDMQPMMSGTTTKILRDHSSYADVTPLDSKEIYAEGDRIVINVNFKRDNKIKLETEDKTGLILEEKKTSISETTIGHKISSKKDDTIYWASPPPSTSTTTPSIETQTTKQLTTTITRTEDNQSVNTSKTMQKTNEKSDSTLNENLINKKDNKVIDELRFLPRSLHQTDIRPPISGQSVATYGPHTPEGDYDENQFMPTPTQDESQSPLRSNSMTSSSSSQSSQSSPTLSITEDNDVYDPEAPLQSPVDHQSVPVSSSPQKKSVSLRTPLSPKENMRTKEKPLPARRPPSAERLQKFSPKDIPKSSPASSSSHSIHSPFKSPSVLPQRQQMKSSPQKPIPQKSTSLMPPPVLPSMRPSVTSSIAVTAAAIASINPTNLAQLLQMAQSLKNPSQQPTQQQTRQTLTQRLMTNNISQQQSAQHQNHALNRDHNEVVDMDVESPSPPQISSSNRVSSTTSTTATVKTLWDQIIKSTQQSKGSIQLTANKRMTSGSKLEPKKLRSDHLIPSSSTVKHLHHRHQVINVTDSKNQLKNGNKLDQLTVLDDVPSSAVEMAVKEKFIKKLNRQERVIEEVKLVLKPHYQKRTVTKEEYKEILRKSVPKICHSKSGEINPVKIKSLIEGYVKRFKYLRKKSKKLPKH